MEVALNDADNSEEDEQVVEGDCQGLGAPVMPVHNMSASHKKDREVVQQDAMTWLCESDEPFDGSIFTGIPDMLDVHETCSKARRKAVGALQLAMEYKEWFRACAMRLFSRLAVGQCAVFSQTDSRVVQEEGGRVVEWLGKCHLLCSVAEEVAGVQLLWHKIALDSAAAPCSHRPGFTHVLCFGKQFSFKVSAFLTPDVLDRGRMTWLKATGLEVCLLGVLFLRHVVGAPLVLNPFCGHGTILAVANYFGMPARGVEVLPKRCRRSRSLDLRGVLDRVPLETFCRLGLPPSALPPPQPPASGQPGCLQPQCPSVSQQLLEEQHR
mmetsp:Transcript_23164/g.39201  ORF Transcript_23164/g.39201 Transcript_23164/m.39201 type:complete len:324 (-) Transcript_23164:81-1052(-)